MKSELQEVQRYGRNKDTIINLLKHRTGTLLEDMYWIDIESLKIVASETDQKIASKIRYSKKTKEAIEKIRIY